jgi:hypothetical protein
MTKEIGLMIDCIERLVQNQKHCTEALAVIQRVLEERQGDTWVSVGFTPGLGGPRAVHVLCSVPWAVLLAVNDHLSQIVVENGATLASARARLTEMERGKHEDAQDPAQPH